MLILQVSQRKILLKCRISHFAHSVLLESC